MKHIFVFLIILSLPLSALAVQESRPLPEDNRLRVMTYNPNGIHKYVGYYEYAASILLGKGEKVASIAMGDKRGWEITPAGRRIFIKPIADNPEFANTNMLLITNKRKYHFILEAAEVGEEGINDPDLVFETKFIYPDDGGDDIQQYVANKGPDLSEPEKYNFNYTISGADFIAPLRVFDDGEFTYFQFKHKNAEVPAFFLVDSQGREALINYRVTEDYIVVERVASQLTLRHGEDVTCVFNETMPLRRSTTPKKKSFFKEKA